MVPLSEEVSEEVSEDGVATESGVPDAGVSPEPQPVSTDAAITVANNSADNFFIFIIFSSFLHIVCAVLVQGISPVHSIFV